MAVLLSLWILAVSSTSRADNRDQYQGYPQGWCGQYDKPDEPPDLDRMQLSDFEVTADGRKVLACITDQTPLTSQVTDDDQVVAIFSHSSCSRCQFLSVCRVKRHQGNYRLNYELADLATSKRREQQETAHFKERYKIRSGIEATISEANRLTGLKRSWTRRKNSVSMSVFIKFLP